MEQPFAVRNRKIQAGFAFGERFGERFGSNVLPQHSNVDEKHVPLQLCFYQAEGPGGG
jgi:hypothetical protein